MQTRTQDVMQPGGINASFLCTELTDESSTLDEITPKQEAERIGDVMARVAIKQLS